MTCQARFIRAILAAVVVLGAAAGQTPKLSLEEKEHFLRTAEIGRTRGLSEGITDAARATLSDGTLTHDAQIQDIDEFKKIFTSALGTEFNFRDSYRYNIAAYRLSRILDVNMIPPSVERRVRGKTAAVTWWTDDVLMTEKQRYLSKKEPPSQDRWNRQVYIVRVFDQLIYNNDRNLGNLLITKNWDLWMIDHTRAFRLHKDLKDSQGLTRCERRLLKSLRALDRATLQAELKPFLTNGEINAMLVRRDKIVQIFDDRVARLGEIAVLYDSLPAER